MRISDWSSDVCSSDLPDLDPQRTETFEFGLGFDFKEVLQDRDRLQIKASHFITWGKDFIDLNVDQPEIFVDCNPFIPGDCDGTTNSTNVPRSEEHTSELQSLMRISYAVFCLKKKTQNKHTHHHEHNTN